MWRTNSQATDEATAMERLEERLLFSTGPVTIGDAAGVHAKSLLYYDTDGTKVTVSLRRGSAEINWAGGAEWDVDKRGVAVVGGLGDTAEIDVIELAGTGAKSTLTFKTAKPKGKDNPFPDADLFAAIGGITGAGADVGLGKLAAPKVNVHGFADGDELVGVRLGGGAKDCVLGDVEAPVLMAFGGSEADKLKFTAGEVLGASLSFEGTLTKLAVRGWAMGGTVTAGEVGSIVSSAGTFAADVVATRGGIKTVTVKGGNLQADLTAENGAIGNIKVTGKVLKHKEDGWLWGEIVGGGLMGAITAGQVKGKSIGNITVTGGTMGEEGSRVVIRAAGDVGNITNKWMGYKESYWNANDKQCSTTCYGPAGVSLDLRSESGMLGNVNITGGDLTGSLWAFAGMKNISVTAGNVSAALTTPEGMVAGIKVASKVVYEPYYDPPEAQILGGNLSGQITAGQVRGKSVGNLTVTGGAIGVDGEALVVRAAGDVGNITNKWASYKKHVMGENGRIQKHTAYRRGGVAVDVISEAGKMGNVNVTGGDFWSSVVAPAGIGKVSVTAGDFDASLRAENGAVAGINAVAKVVSPDGEPDYLEVMGGSISGAIFAGQAKGKAVGNITATGGWLGASGALTIEAVGDVGNITAKGLKYSVPCWNDFTERMGRETIYQECGAEVAVTSTAGNVGMITVTGGDLSGAVFAAGTAKGISGKAVKVQNPYEPTMYVGGAVMAEVEAGAIGSITSVGSDLSGRLVSNKIGSVTAKAVTQNATTKRYSEWGESWVEVMDGQAFGGNIAGLEIYATGPDASVGAITAVGGEANVTGEVSFDPLSAKVVSKPVQFTMTYEENDSGRLVAVKETIGGPEMVSNGLLQAEPIDEDDPMYE